MASAVESLVEKLDTAEVVTLSRDDWDFIKKITREDPEILSLGSLERAPGKKDNWVEQVGGLPKYIEKIAEALHTRRGMSISRAIATAVSRVKRWAKGGGDVDADTQAKAAAALAQWNAKKARAKSKK